MLNSYFLETVNGVLAIAAISILIITIPNIIRGESATPPGQRAVTAITVYMAGVVFYRSWIWLWRHLQNDGHDVSWVSSIPIPFVGMCLMIIGSFMMVHVFSRSNRPPWIWLAFMVAIVIMFSLIAVF